MPGAARYPIDICSGHDGYPPRNNTGGSADIMINGYGAHRQDDSWEIHCLGINCHAATLISGSPTVLANGKQIGRIGDPLSCGSTIATGSSDVILD